MGLFGKKNIKTIPDHFGLDINDFSLKAVEIRSTRKKQRVVGIQSTPLSRGVVVDGVIIKMKEFGVALAKVRETAKPHKIVQKHVVCSLPDSKSFLRIIHIPKMNAEEAEEAVKWEMDANIPLPIDQVHYDWKILERNFSKDKAKMSVIVTAVPRTVVEQYLEVLTEAGLKVIGFEIESIAQTRSLLVQKKKDHTTLIVDIGDRRTSFVIAVDDIPCFTSSSPLSAYVMTDTIAKSLGVSLEEAEKIKSTYGVGSTLKNDHIFTAIKPVLENFVQEIERSTNFYLRELRYSDDVNEILLCGSGAKMKGIVPYLSHRLGRKITLGDPWKNVVLDKKIPPINHETSIQYATAIGLSLKDCDL